MRRFILILFCVLIAAVAVTIGAAWYLLRDESFLKSRVSAFVLRETGRTLTIDGPLRLELGRQTRIEASNIHFANVAWAEEPDMVRIGRMVLVLDVPSLFGDRTIAPLISVEDCAVSLVEREDGTNNWAALTETTEEAAEETDSAQLSWALLDAQVRNCRLSHAAPSRPQPLRVEVAELSQRLGQDQRWQINGTANIGEEPFTINGWLTPARSLVLGGPLEHKLEVRLGATTLQSSGTVQDAATGQGVNVDVRFHGPDIANVLAFLDLPPASTGPFDFRLSLDTEGQMTRLTIDGNLGSIQADAQGEMDKLLEPSRGGVTGAVEGPDLALLGAALGIEGLAASKYSLEAEVGFEPGLVRFDRFELTMPGDKLSLVGALGNDAMLAATDLEVVASSEEIGRWAAAFGQVVRDLGPIALRGRFHRDANGQAALTARVEYLQNSLTVAGDLGSLDGPLQPDLKVDFHSSNLESMAVLLDDVTLPAAPMTIRGQVSKRQERIHLERVELNLGGHQARLDGQVTSAQTFAGSELDVQVSSLSAADLGRLFGEERLPAAPFTLSGHIGRPDQRIQLQNLVLDFAGHRAEVTGFINPEDKFSGSEIEARLSTPDLSALALLFGWEELPSESLALSGMLKAEGHGIRFETTQGELGEMRLAAKGQIPDLEQPFRIDADFDIRLPSLKLIAFAAPEVELPDMPFTAIGRLHNHPDRTELENIRLSLGELAAAITGEVYTDQRFDLSIEAGGPDATALQEWVGQPLAPAPFSLRTHAFGYPSAFELADLDVQLGKSQVDGDLAIRLGVPKTVSGKLVSPFLDLSHWRTVDQAEPPADEEPPSAFVFDDTDVMRFEDYGVEADVTLKVAELDLGNTRLRDLELGVLLTPNRLEFAPFSLRGEYGSALRGRAVLDDSGAKPVLDVMLDAQDLRMALSAVPGQDPNTIPPLELHVSLHGAGSTRREIASSLDGSIRAFTGSGLIASAGINMLFSDFLSELYDALNPLAETRNYARLECSVWAADFVSGQVTVDPVIAQIEEFTVLSKGKIDLQTEKISLSFNTKPRKGLGITAGTVINTVIKVGGNLKTPAIEIDPAGVIVGGTAAVATAGLSIVAKSFSDRFLSSKNPCGDARKELAKRDGS